MANQFVWVDIPVKDLDRAIRFYSAVLGSPVKKEQLGETIAIGTSADAWSKIRGRSRLRTDRSSI